MPAWAQGEVLCLSPLVFLVLFAQLKPIPKKIVLRNTNGKNHGFLTVYSFWGPLGSYVESQELLKGCVDGLAATCSSQFGFAFIFYIFRLGMILFLKHNSTAKQREKKKLWKSPA